MKKLHDELLQENLIISYILSICLTLAIIILAIVITIILLGSYYGIAVIPMILILIADNFWLVLGVVFAYKIAIWISTKKACQMLVNQKKILHTSFCFSLIMNLIVWVGFSIGYILENLGDAISKIGFVLVLLLEGVFIAVIIKTFTTGLLIVYVMHKKYRKMVVAYPVANDTDDQPEV